MSKGATIRARVEPMLKEQAEGVLEQLGLSVTAAITLFYKQIVSYRGLPFEVRIPNTATLDAMRDAAEGRDLIRAASVSDLISTPDTE